MSDKIFELINHFLSENNLSSSSPETIKIALTHPSYTNEKSLNYDQNYERLEFLGDAVLKLIASKYLFNRYPEMKEGDLSKIRAMLVSDLCLSGFAKKIKMQELILLGNVDVKKKNGLPVSILACAFEGMLGALYLTSNFEEIEKFLIKFFDEVVEDIKNNAMFVNAKAMLQEYTQSVNKDLPVYDLIKENGPEHNKTFEVSVSYGNKVLAIGVGKNKKEAQQNAAFEACKKLGITDKNEQ